MEEAVGKIWHNWITHKAENSFPEACVSLHSIQKAISIFFRAIGGDAGLKIEAATPRAHGAHRSLLQRIAGSHCKAALAWRNNETLRLPNQISLYPTHELNRDLYFWLAAMACAGECGSVNEANWFYSNQQRTLHTLKIFPGLKTRYQRLINAELERRQYFSGECEGAIKTALITPGKTQRLPSPPKPPHPVYLWLYPQLETNINCTSKRADSANETTDATESKQLESEQQHRYRAEQANEPDGKNGLITMRWENIFSWAEYIKVNRATDDEEDKDAAQKAADMEVLSISQDNKGSATRIRLDLDLPAAEYDDTPLEGETSLPEWDWKKGTLVADQCIIKPMLPRGTKPQPLPDQLQRTARTLRSQFAALIQNRQWLRGQRDGSEIDMEAYLDQYTRPQTKYSPEKGLYRDLRTSVRDMATLILADASMSTDAAVNNEQRVIDVIKESLLLFTEALNASGDRHALYAFSSRKREEVRLYPLKCFEDKYNDTVRGHIQAIRPGYYTRMGAAIRHTSNILSQQAAHKQLLLIITDGKPNDLDKYEGRYGIEDTRQAILEAKQRGLIPFCITIDSTADQYLPYLFGHNHFVVVKRATELPKRIISLYTQLSRTC